MLVNTTPLSGLDLVDMAGSFEFENMERLIGLLVRGGRQAPTLLGRALYDEANVMFNESQDQVPMDTGVLRSSGNVHAPAISHGEVLVEISYGGAAAPYALRQHENEEYKHAPGRKAKYLSDPVEDGLPDLGRNITDRLEAMVRGLI